MPELIETRFGRIRFLDEDVVTFPEGIVGFPELTEFLLVTQRAESPFRWLQSIGAPELAFLLADPNRFVSDYQPTLSDEDAESLGITEDTPTLLYTTASIPPGKPEDTTLNLAGPIVINAVSRTGKQCVLDNEAYTIKHRVVHPDSKADHSVAA